MGFLKAPVDSAFLASRHWLQGLSGGSAPNYTLVQFHQTKAELLKEGRVEGRCEMGMLVNP